MPYSDTYFMYGSLLWYSKRVGESNTYFEKAVDSSNSDEDKASYRNKIENLQKTDLR